LRLKIDKEDTKYSVTFLTGIRRSTSFWFLSFEHFENISKIEKGF
jgi:hypothetical protein